MLEALRRGFTYSSHAYDDGEGMIMIDLRTFAILVMMAGLWVDNG